MEGNSPASDPGLTHCDSCQGPLPLGSTFCPNCGARRPILDNPLGPKTLGGIFEGTFQIYGAGFLGILIIVALVQVPLSLLGFWFESLLENAMVKLFGTLDPSIFDPSTDTPFDPFSLDIASIIEELLPVFYLLGALIIATWLTSILMAGALIYGVSGQILGRSIAVGRAYSFSLGRFGAMLGASILGGLAVVLMAITIIGIPFAIFFAVRWIFLYQAAALEKCGPSAALARSSDLVRDNWWRVFGILLLIGISVGIANAIASGILGLIPLVGPILLVVVAVLFAPVVVIAQTLLYHDLRARRDGPAGYDPEVLASELQSSRGL